MALNFLPTSNSAFALVLAAALTGCASARVVTRPDPSPTCVVLSAGGESGVAHLGALQAVREAGLAVDCVVGTSMGALVGGLYASAPGEEAVQRYLRFVRAYHAGSPPQPPDNAEARVALNALAWGISSLFGVRVSLLATEPLDHARFAEVLDTFVEGRTVEQLPVPLVTQVTVRDGATARVEGRAGGALSEAVAASVLNPAFFRSTDVRGAQGIPPDVDLPAAVPVEDACRRFPAAKLLAINVTGAPAVYPASLPCPLLEVDVARRLAHLEEQPPREDVFRPGRWFDLLVEEGRRATAEALQDQEWTVPREVRN